jgi:signal transduction histidine kinase
VATDLPKALKVVAEMMTYLFDAEVTLITVPAAEGTDLQILAEYRRNTTSLATAPSVFPLNELPTTRLVLDQGQTLILSDIQNRPLPPPVRAYVEALDLHTGMLIPLQVGGNVVGVLAVVVYQPDRTFGVDEIALAETIAGDIALVVKNTQLAAQAQTAAVVAERQRLARDLHDSVTQSLYSLTLLASGWGTMAAQGRLNQQQVTDSFRQLGDVGQQALKEMRLLIHQLRPPILEEVGLVGALQQRLESVEHRVNIETNLYTRGAEELPLDVTEQLYGITLETLNNTLRHARATEVTINLQVEDNYLRLVIQDNGIGFDPTAPSMGLGLTSMQERAQAINAKLQITSALQQGTTVEVTLALEPGNEENLTE